VAGSWAPAPLGAREPPKRPVGKLIEQRPKHGQCASRDTEGPLNYHRRSASAYGGLTWLEVACNRCNTRANLAYRRTPSAGCGYADLKAACRRKTATATRGAITPNSSASSLVSTKGRVFAPDSLLVLCTLSATHAHRSAPNQAPLGDVKKGMRHDVAIGLADLKRACFRVAEPSGFASGENCGVVLASSVRNKNASLATAEAVVAIDIIFRYYRRN
jgi:hypothetical protein